MKIEQPKDGFQPITITLESIKEVNDLFFCLLPKEQPMYAPPQPDIARQISVFITKEAKL